MLGDISTNEILNTQIKENLENDGNIEKSKIPAINFGSNRVLNNNVDPENINRFNY